MKNIWENETGIITLATDKQAEKLNYVGGNFKKAGKDTEGKKFMPFDYLWADLNS